MAAPTLAIRLTAQFSEFRAALRKAKSETQTAVSGMSKQFDKLGASIGLIGAGSLVGVLGSLKSLANEIDTVGKSAQGLGVSTEFLSGLRFAADFSQVGVNELSSAVAKLNRKLTEAQAGGAAKQAFSDLGVDVDGIRNVEEAIDAVADRFKELDDGTVKTTAALRLFEESGFKFVNFLNLGSDGIRQFREEAASLGLVYSKQQTEDAARFNDEIERLVKAVKGLAVTSLGGTVGELADFLETTRLIEQAAGDAGNSTGTLLETVEATVKTFLGITPDRLTSSADKWAESVDRAREAYEKMVRIRDANVARGALGAVAENNKQLKQLKQDLDTATAGWVRLQSARNAALADANQIAPAPRVQGGETGEKALSDGQKILQQLALQRNAVSDLTTAEKLLADARVKGQTISSTDRDRILQLGNEVDLLRKATEEQKKFTAARKAEADRLAAADTRDALEFAELSANAEQEAAEVIRRTNAEYRARADAIRDVLDPNRELIRQLEEIRELEQATEGLNASEAQQARNRVSIQYFRQLSDAAGDSQKELSEVGRIMETLKANAAQTFADAAFEAENFGDVLRGLLIQIGKLTLNRGLFNLFDFVAGKASAVTGGPGTSLEGGVPSLSVPFGASQKAVTSVNNYYIPADLTIGQVESVIDRKNKTVTNNLYDSRVRGGVFA